jgi:hypothetical protein
MALPHVSITLSDGELGLAIPNTDGVCGMILQGPAAADLAVGVSAQLTSLQDAVDLGIDEDYDTDEDVTSYRQIKEFYDVAPKGTVLWIIILSQALTLTQILDKANAYATKLLNDADGAIKLLTVARSPASGYTPTVTNGIDADVEAAIIKAQALAAEYHLLFTPLGIIIPALYYNGNTANLPNLKASTAYYVQVLLGDTVDDSDNAAVGLLLGRYAADPVQRNPGRVKTGPLPILGAYLGDETLTAAAGDNASIHDKGFITFQQYAGKAGIYFTDDPTAVAATSDYSSMARVRVINKAVRIAYVTFVNEIKDEVRVDIDGRIEPAQAKYFQGIIENAVNINMTGNNEIVSFRSLIDPAQNVLSTGKVEIALKITPFAYAKEIDVTLGFENPALAA